MAWLKLTGLSVAFITLGSFLMGFLDQLPTNDVWKATVLTALLITTWTYIVREWSPK